MDACGSQGTVRGLRPPGQCGRSSGALTRPPRVPRSFQQATLFVHAGPKIGGSGVNWLKAGIELDGGKENLG